MDYEDIYNRFEAGGQNVNVRNGHARVRAVRSQPRQRLIFFLFCIKVDIVRKRF